MLHQDNVDWKKGERYQDHMFVARNWNIFKDTIKKEFEPMIKLSVIYESGQEKLEIGQGRAIKPSNVREK
jgi:hypothetical protein